MYYRLNEISKGFYSFSVWDRNDNLLILHVGTKQTVLRGAKDVGYDITNRLKE